MRLIYKYDLDYNDFYILALGERNAKSINSIYNIVKNRDKSEWNHLD